MTFAISTERAIEELARDPVRHVVLLKQLLACPEQVTAYRASDADGTAILLALDAAASVYDRQTYPTAEIVAFISSDHPDLTAALLTRLQRGVGIVFKLSHEADLIPIQREFSVARRTAFVSFTSDGDVEPDAAVRVTATPGDAAVRMFETQGHERAWIEAMLERGRAFACVLERASVCLVYEDWGPVWEVGGVVTDPDHRRKGFGARVVRTALARSVGLVPFVTITHYVTSGQRPA